MQKGEKGKFQGGIKKKKMALPSVISHKTQPCSSEVYRVSLLRLFELTSQGLKISTLLAGHSSISTVFGCTDSERTVHCELTLENQATQRRSQGLAAPGADSDVCSFLQQKEGGNGSQLLCYKRKGKNNTGNQGYKNQCCRHFRKLKAVIIHRWALNINSCKQKAFFNYGPELDSQQWTLSVQGALKMSLKFQLYDKVRVETYFTGKGFFFFLSFMLNENVCLKALEKNAVKRKRK